MSTITLINPANYQEIGDVEVSTGKEIQEKVQKAQKARHVWREIGLEKRVELLRKVLDLFKTKADELSVIATKEMGFPKKQQMDFDVGEGLNYFNWYLENVAKYISPDIMFENESEKHTVYYEPIGTAAVIQPWNFPFCQWSWSVVPNLAVGNTVVFKHSEQCLKTGKIIEKVVNSVLPEGVFNEVYGNEEVGRELLSQNINLICFTGSTEVGKKIYELAGKGFIKALMEMGGSAPCIVFDDVEVDEASEIIYEQRFANNGQCCDGLKRLLAHESIFDAVVAKLKSIIRLKKIGNPEQLDTDFGPLSSKKHLGLLISQVEDAVTKGAKIIIGGKVPEGLIGAYYEPTILTNITPDMQVWSEEVFGPVLPIMSFKTEEEAIRLANDTQYGLGGYVYTKDPELASRVAAQIESGMISVNGASYICPFNPFGGYKASGMGRGNGKFGFTELTQIKIVSTKK